MAKSFNAKFKKVDEKAIEKLEEFGKLSKEKEKLLKYKDKGKTDEEKYQSAAKTKRTWKNRQKDKKFCRIWIKNTIINNKKIKEDF